MAILNLYLTTEKALTKEDVKHIHPNWTKRQLNALSVILANLITYKKFWVRYESRNQANVIPRYNPLNIGHKVMVVIVFSSFNNAITICQNKTHCLGLN